MALDQPFTWGANGARMTPEDIAAQRKVADAMAVQAGDASPFPMGTRGFGEVTQGLNRIAKGISAGMDYREADAASKANADDNKAMIADMLGKLGGAAPAAAPVASAPVASGAPVASAAPAGSLDPETTGYVNAAATKFGVDPAYMTKTALLESGGRADATNPSGAAGLYQFMPKTAKQYGLDNPLDPEDSAMAAAELAADNKKSLAKTLGRDPSNGELYLAHQQGADGAAALLANPNAPAAQIVGRQAVLQNGGTDDMTAGQFAHKWMDKFGPPSQAAPVQVASADPAAAVPGAAVAKVAAAYPTLANAAAPAVAVAPVTAVAAASPGAVAKVAGAIDPAALPPEAAPTQGYAVPGQPAAPAAPAALSPGVAKVAGAINPAVLNAYTSPYASAQTKALAGMVLQKQLTEGAKEHYTPQTDADGNQYDLGSDGKRSMFSKADEKTTAQKDYEYYKKSFTPTDQQPTPMGFDTWTTAKAKAGAVSLSNIGNVDTKSGDTYDAQMTGGLAKSHAALVNGVEGAQTRARDINAMQAAVDAIQQNGGTTGGMAPEQVLKLQKTINTGANWMGLDKPFEEKDLSDKEFLTKFNRSMAGAQAKDAVGSRVTNFEMGNYLKSNPGLDMSLTGNQRLLGIQGQIEQRNIDVGNALRAETAKGISTGKHIDPVTAQKIITDYDEAHHIQDPVTGQDLTKNYALPEFNRTGQGGTSNDALAATHAANVTKIGGYTIKPVSP